MAGREHARLLAAGRGRAGRRHRGRSGGCGGDRRRRRRGPRVEADVASDSDARGLVDAALDTFGRVDIVINNAGILRSYGVGETTDAMWDEVLGVNLRGAFMVTPPPGRR